MKIINFIKKFIKNFIDLFKDNTISVIFFVICVSIYIIQHIMINFFNFNENVLQILFGSLNSTFFYVLKDYYRLITYIFLHKNLIHLIMNMYGLLIFGKIFVDDSNKKLILPIIFFGGIFGGIFHIYVYNFTFCVGISGSIYGFATFVLLDLIFNYDNNVKDFFGYAIILIISICENFIPNVSWAAHLGGAVAGALIFFIYNYRHNRKLKIITIVSSILISTIIVHAFIIKLKNIDFSVEQNLVYSYSYFLSNEYNLPKLGKHYADTFILHFIK